MFSYNRPSNNISSLLNTLPSGTYRDPTRISSDASALLSATIGRNLRSSSHPLILNDGTSHSRLLSLQGTVAMTYRGNTYNVPIEIFVPPAYPIRPPYIFVRPVANMVIKENHKHVGSDGMVYMPYLHQWKPTSNMTEMCVILSSLFGSDPPVYSRPASSVTQPSVARQQQHVRPSATATSVRTEDYEENERRRLRAEEERRREQEMIEKALKASREEEEKRLQEKKRLEEEERRRLEEVTRIAEEEARREEEERRRREEEDRQEMMLVQTMRDDLTVRLRRELQTFNDHAKDQIASDLRDQTKLENGEKTIKAQLTLLKERKEQLSAGIEEVEEKTTQAESDLQTLEENHSDDDNDPIKAVDKLAIPNDVYSRQMLELSSKNAAITDCLYFLDKALVRGTIPLDVHLKKVRQLAKKQFLARAHLLKVGEVAKLGVVAG